MPGELTATEQRILEGLAAGLYDAEIAVRVGVPVGDLKQRVTAILQREHLTDREALLAWYRGESRGEAHLGVNESGRRVNLRPWVVPAIGAAGFVAGVALTLAFTWPGDEPAADASTDPAGASSPVSGEEIIVMTAVPAIANRISTPPLLVGNAVTIDYGFAPIVITYPDGGALTGRPNLVERLYLDPETRLVVSETIWEEPEDGFLYHAITNDLGTLVAVKYNDGAGGDWLDLLTVGGELLARYELARNQEPILFYGDKVVLAQGTSLNSYTLAGNSEGLAEPDAALGPPLGWVRGYGIAWYSGEGYVSDDKGNRIFRVGAGITHDLVPRAMGVLRDDGLVTEVRVRGNDTRLDSPSFVSFDAGVALVAWTADEGTFTSLIALGDGSLMSTRMGGLFPAGTASGLRFVVNYCQQGEDCAFAYGRPAVYSVLDGRLQELAGLDAGRRLIGSQRGPFALVLPGAECWPIRESLELRNETIVWCAQPGEPLTLYDLEPIESYYPGQPRILHSEGLLDYVRVLAPNGEPGWIRVDAVQIGPFPEPGP